MSTRPVSVFMDSLVHASAVGEPFLALRHLAFILAGVAAGTLAIAAMFVTLALGGPRPIAEMGLLALLAGEVAVAAYVSRTGNIEIAQIASAILLTALIVGLAAMTGGAQSPALVWIAFVPLDASLAGSRRALMAASAIAAAGVGGIFAASSLLGEEARVLPHDFNAFPAMIAVLVGAALTLRMGWMISGMTRLADATEPVTAQDVVHAVEADGPALPTRSADVTAFVPKERPRPGPWVVPAADLDESKELRRA